MYQDNHLACASVVLCYLLRTEREFGLRVVEPGGVKLSLALNRRQAPGLCQVFCNLSLTSTTNSKTTQCTELI